MTAEPQRGVVALVAHARHVSAAERELFATRLRARLESQSLLVETCHRVEAYTANVNHDQLAVIADLLPEGGRLLSGAEAARHAIQVAVGRDSVVQGEDQILHQIRVAVAQARAAGSLDRLTERLFALALRAGRRARSWRSGHPRSLADSAVEVARHRGLALTDAQVLVVGAGRMGAIVARAFIAAGASVTIANRSPEGSRALASEIGARVAPLDPGMATANFQVVIVALAGPWIIEPATAEAMGLGKGLVIDLSFPPAVAPSVADALGDRLVTSDQLAIASSPATADEPAERKIDALIEATLDEFLAWHARGNARAVSAALVRHADAERVAELEALWRALPTLDLEERAAIENMTRHLAERLLREPLQRLGAADAPDERVVRDLFAL